MDMVNITPTVLNGNVNTPPSKSFAHRAVIAGFLSENSCCISNLSLSQDIKATLDCAKALGAKFSFDKKSSSVTFKDGFKSIKRTPKLDCGESGSTLRFFIPIALALYSKAKFTGHGRLMERPLTPYFDIFEEKGISYNLKNGVLTVKGKLEPGIFKIDGGISSQFITGLLFALPLLDGDSKIEIEGNLSSRSYVDITISVLRSFGIEIENENYSAFNIKGNQQYKSQNYTVEGDFSQAAFFLVAGAIGCNITCHGLDENSLQGDKKIVEIIEETGAKVERCGNSSLRAIHTGRMHGITIDVDEIPDLVPILAVLLCFCKGTSRIENAGRLRLKESDRLAAICSELKKMGADITEGEDFLEIKGKQVLCGGRLSSWNDHRIAMALAIAACRTEGEVVIDGAKHAVKKSYPNFFDDYKTLGGNVE